jgi:hypothetical protein
MIYKLNDLKGLRIDPQEGVSVCDLRDGFPQAKLTYDAVRDKLYGTTTPRPQSHKPEEGAV